MVSADEHDLGARLADVDEKGVEDVEGLGAGCGGVEDVAAGDDDVDLEAAYLLAESSHDGAEGLEGAVAVERTPDVPVARVQNPHA